MDRVQLSQECRATTRRQFAFYHKVPQSSWYPFDQPQKDERLSRPWCHPVLLNLGTPSWESSALTVEVITAEVIKAAVEPMIEMLEKISLKVRNEKGLVIYGVSSSLLEKWQAWPSQLLSNYITINTWKNIPLSTIQ